MSKKKNLTLDKKDGISILGLYERRLIDTIIPHIPAWIEGYHLTLTTIIWCLGILIFSYIASKTGNLHWLWLVSIMIFLQYVTDSLDGSLGKYRDTGIIRWGYYMDHFLDYIFLGSIVIGYCFVIPKVVLTVEFQNEILVDNFKMIFFKIPIEINYYYLMMYVFMIFAGFMVNSFLSFSVTNKFKISYIGIGPTEIRLIFIIINTLIIIFGKTYMGWALPYILAFASIGLIVVVYKTQKMLRKLDMEEKANRDKKGSYVKLQNIGK